MQVEAKLTVTFVRFSSEDSDQFISEGSGSDPAKGVETKV
jgi:hypothetical protein